MARSNSVEHLSGEVRVSDIDTAVLFSVRGLPLLEIEKVSQVKALFTFRDARQQARRFQVEYFNGLEGPALLWFWHQRNLKDLHMGRRALTKDWSPQWADIIKSVTIHQVPAIEIWSLDLACYLHANGVPIVEALKLPKGKVRIFLGSRTERRCRAWRNKLVSGEGQVRYIRLAAAQRSLKSLLREEVAADRDSIVG